MTEVPWAEELPAIRLPSWSDRIYPSDRAPSPGDPIPLFGDDIWPVRFFSKNPSMGGDCIHWKTFPARYVDHFRLVTWALFNVPIPDELLARRGGPMVPTLSALRIFHSSNDFRILGRWLEARGVEKIGHLSAGLMTDYAEYLRTERRVARSTAVNHLTAITRLWVVGIQIPQLRLAGCPPWATGRSEDYLPATTRAAGENNTDPIAPATISALIGAAIRMVETGTDAIVRAAELHRAVQHAGTNNIGGEGRVGSSTLRAYLDGLKEECAPVPMKVHNRKWTIDATYIAYANSVSTDVVYNWMRNPEVKEYAAERGAAITVNLAGNDLMPARIPLTEVQAYVSLLRAACFVVVTYLTGMRPSEALALEPASLHPSSHDGGWMLLRSRTFKTARDERGNHDSNGQIRTAPWVAVSPVIKAIKALELLVGGEGLLFPSARGAGSVGRSVGLTTIADGVIRFIDHLNTLKPGTIPSDPAGRVTPMRFRRTLAWHIANQPGGLVALAIQYGHLKTAVSEGYASRVRDGIHDLIDFETARSIAKRLSEAAEAFGEGEGVSGPAALRFVSALRQQTEQFNGIVTSPRQAQSLLKNSALSVYQNDDAFVWCNFQRDTALCLSGPVSTDVATPKLEQCVSNCSNICRTDRQTRDLRNFADGLRREAEYMPVPSAERLRAKADELDSCAEQHDNDRRTREDFDAEY
jgi:hypothetical protein